MRSLLVRILAFACLLAVVGPGTSLSETIYSNFSTDHGGWGYDLNSGWFIVGDDVPVHPGVARAASFNVAQSGVLTDIWLAMRYVLGDEIGDSVTLYLVPKPDNQPPVVADALEQWTITEFESSDQWHAPLHLVSDGATILDAGLAYWLVAVPGSTTLCIWGFNSEESITCPSSSRVEGEDWSSVEDRVASAFRVDIRVGVAVEVETWGSVKRLFR